MRYNHFKVFSIELKKFHFKIFIKYLFKPNYFKVNFYFKLIINKNGDATAKKNPIPFPRQNIK